MDWSPEMAIEAFDQDEGLAALFLDQPISNELPAIIDDFGLMRPDSLLERSIDSCCTKWKSSRETNVPSVAFESQFIDNLNSETGCQTAVNHNHPNKFLPPMQQVFSYYPEKSETLASSQKSVQPSTSRHPHYNQNPHYPAIRIPQTPSPPQLIGVSHRSATPEYRSGLPNRNNSLHRHPAVHMGSVLRSSPALYTPSQLQKESSGLLRSVGVTTVQEMEFDHRSKQCTELRQHQSVCLAVVKPRGKGGRKPKEFGPHMTESEKARLDQRRANNRAAATKYRKKREEKIETLENKVSSLERELRTKDLIAKNLQRQLEQIRRQLEENTCEACHHSL